MIRAARGAVSLLCCGLFCLNAQGQTAYAQKAEKKAEDPERAVVGRSLSPKAMIFRRAARINGTRNNWSLMKTSG